LLSTAPEVSASPFVVMAWILAVGL